MFHKSTSRDSAMVIFQTIDSGKLVLKIYQPKVIRLGAKTIQFLKENTLNIYPGF